MANIKEALVARLKNHATVKAIAADRHFPEYVPDTVSLYPRSTYQLISHVKPKAVNGGFLGQGVARFQINCWGDGTVEGYRQSDLLANAVATALDGQTWTAAGIKVLFGLLENVQDAGLPPSSGIGKGDSCAQFDVLLVYIEV
jgi:hypothetical protein